MCMRLFKNGVLRSDSKHINPKSIIVDSAHVHCEQCVNLRVTLVFRLYQKVPELAAGAVKE
jgi:hypothetical protein